MMKLNSLAFIFILLLLTSCAKTEETKDIVCNPPYLQVADTCCLDENSNSICDVDEPSSELEIQDIDERCSSPCNDANECTRDICTEITGFDCVHQPISPCCGNNICDSEETYFDCPDDCEDFIDVLKLQDALMDSFGKKNLIFDRDDEDGIRIYSNRLLYGSLLEFTDRKDYILSKKQFRSKIPLLTPLRISMYDQDASSYAEREGYDQFDSSILKNEVSSIDDVHEVYYRYNYYKVSKQGMINITQLSEISLRASFYVLCAPNMVVEINDDPNFKFSKLFKTRTTEEIDKDIREHLDELKTQSTLKIQKMLEYCKENRDFIFT